VAGGDAVAAGRRLGTDGILEGTLERGGGRIRAAVSLIRVRDGRVLWSDSFDERESEPFLLEDAISDRLVRALALRIAPSEAKRLAGSAPRREAYEAYLKGRYFWNRRTTEGFHEAIREFQAALSADPRFAPAWSGIADARVLLGPGRPGEFRLAREAAEKALAIDPDLAEAHASLAMAKFFGEWDFAGSEREFRRALYLAPGYATAHHWYAYWLAAMGRFDEAIREIRRAREIDPTSLAVNRDVGHVLLYSRRYDEAGAALRDTLRMDPAYHQARIYLLMDLSYAGRREEAAAEVRALSAFPEEGGAGGWEAVIEARAGHPEALRRRLPEKIRAAESGAAGSESVATDYGWLGEKDEAFVWLERALRERRFYLVFLKADPAFDPLRSDPRFQGIVHRVGLPS
jgi:tetratricopeptide (TPR) repeat protein